MEAANRLLLLGSQLPGQARAGVQTLLVQSGRPWENCANVGSSLGATGPPEKTLWACYRGRKTGTGTGQAEEEKPPGKVAFPYPHLSSLLLVTRRKATLLLIPFQESIPGKTATCPQMGLKLPCFHKGQRLQPPRKACNPQWWCSNGYGGGGSVYQQHLVLSEGVRRCAPWAASLAGRPVVQVQNICPTHGYL